MKKKIKNQWIVSDKETVEELTGSNWNSGYTETIVLKTDNDYYVFNHYPQGSTFSNCTKEVEQLKKEKKW